MSTLVGENRKKHSFRSVSSFLSVLYGRFRLLCNSVLMEVREKHTKSADPNWSLNFDIRLWSFYNKKEGSIRLYIVSVLYSISSLSGRCLFLIPKFYDMITCAQLVRVTTLSYQCCWVWACVSSYLFWMLLRVHSRKMFKLCTHKIKCDLCGMCILQETMMDECIDGLIRRWVDW